MVIVLYHEVIRGERVQGTMFPAGAWGDAPKPRSPLPLRVDYILDQNDVLFVNEPNTIPGSLAFYLWKAGGLDFPKLVEKMVEDALRKHADKNSSVFAYDSSILKKVASGSKGAKR